MSTGKTSSLINKPIASLFNGVSQQPASLRLSSQCELQVNAYSSLVDGLTKRPPSKLEAKLNSDLDEDSFIHFINRDPNERYALIIKDGSLKVYDLEGDEMTIVMTASSSYLDVTGAPRDSFAVITIADYSFIVNKEITTAMDAATSGGTFQGTKQDFGSLPAIGNTGHVWEIEGDPNNNFDNYYVMDNGSTWEETVEPGITYMFDETTMPHQLTRTAVDEFTFDVVTWADRLVGDAESAPDPSFIGKSINDIFLHRNRLGLLSGDNCILSSSPASDFSFFRESATVLIDSDPIDTAASHTKVSTLYHAVPFDKSLMLMSEQTQFILSGTEVLTPSTATIDVSTEFETSSKCKPAAAGANVYFPVPKDNYSGIREYFVEDTVASNDAADVTAHVPQYIDKNLFQLISSSNEDVIFSLSSNTRNKMWCYKFYWDGDEKVQSSWSEWKFDSDTVILGGSIIETDLWLIIKRDDGTFLHKVSLQAGLEDDSMGFQVLLDNREELIGVYDSVNDWTTWTTTHEHNDNLQVILGSSFTNKIGGKLTGLSYPTSTTVRVSGDYSGGSCFIGTPYTLTYTFSEQFIKDSKNNAIREGRLMMRNMAVNYSETGYFKVTVTPEHREPYEYEYTGKVLGAGSFLLGQLQINTGSFPFWLMADSRGVDVTITNDSHLPSTFVSAEWNALYHAKASR